MYWNKKTGKWQTKKIKGAKTKKVKKTIYKNASPKMVVTVDAAKPEEEDVKPGQDDVQPGQDDAQSGQDGTQSGQEDTQPGDTGGDRTEPDLDKIRKDMLDLVNAEREKAGVSPLSLQDEINVCAQEKARDMYTSGKLDHHSDTLGYVQDQFGKHGISANGMGENIAMGQSSVSDVMKSWINSPGHYENIVYSDYTHAGFGYYKGYWVQQFADSPRVNGSDFPEATITCPRCGTTKKESEFGNAMSYTTTGYDGSVIKMYQCNCINIMYLCPKCNTLMEEAGISDNGSVSHKCPKCGYSNTKECYVKCGSCNADLLNNTIEDDFVLHFQGDLSEGSTDFNEVLIELDYCSTCGKYAFINQASRKLYTEMYAKYQQKIGDGEDIYDHIKWYYMVEGEKEQTGENSWVTHRYRKEIPTRKISSLEELLGSSRLYTRD